MRTFNNFIIVFTMFGLVACGSGFENRDQAYEEFENYSSLVGGAVPIKYQDVKCESHIVVQIAKRGSDPTYCLSVEDAKNMVKTVRFKHMDITLEMYIMRAKTDPEYHRDFARLEQRVEDYILRHGVKPKPRVAHK